MAYKQKHDLARYTAPISGTGSWIPGGPSAQAKIESIAHASGTAILQRSGHHSALLVNIPNMSAAMTPPCAPPLSGITGWTHDFLLALPGRKEEHAMGYSPETVEEYIKSGYWKTVER